jgi:molybdopterin-binding protein
LSEFRIGEAAAVLGVSADTARRWADEGLLATRRTAGGHRVVDGRSLAQTASRLAELPDAEPVVGHSARNRFPGIVTKVVKDRVAAQVEIQAGPHRVVSLMTREAADELGLEPGMRAVAAVKATQVGIEITDTP